MLGQLQRLDPFDRLYGRLHIRDRWGVPRGQIITWIEIAFIKVTDIIIVVVVVVISRHSSSSDLWTLNTFSYLGVMVWHV